MSSSFNYKEEYNAVVTCPVCYDTFQSPLILPQCGHTVCSDCLYAIARNEQPPTFEKLNCPVCRTENPISAKNFFGSYYLDFPTNVQIEKMASYWRRMRQPVFDGLHIDTSKCMHSDLVKSPIRCNHCHASFCRSCLFIHLERVRAEINIIACDFEEHRKSVIAMFEDNMQYFASSIEEKVQNTMMEISKLCDSVDESMKTTIETCREKLLAKAREIGEETWQMVESSLGKVIDQPPFPRSDVENLNESSLLDLSLNEVCQLHSKLLEMDQEVFDLEWLQHIPVHGKIEFRATAEKLAEKGAADYMYWGMFVHEDEDELKAPSWLIRLHKAAITGDSHKLHEMLCQLRKFYPPSVPYAVNDHDRNYCEHTLLIEAAERGHLSVVKLLVKKYSADLFIRDEDNGETALHVAVKNDHSDIVQFLVEYDSDIVFAKDYDDDHTAIWKAVNDGQIDMVACFCEVFFIDGSFMDDSDYVTLAAKNGDLEMVKLIVEQGESACVKDDRGFLALHHAAHRGHIDIVRYLLDNYPEQALEKAKDGRNFTCILASLDSRADMLDILLQENRLAISYPEPNTTTNIYLPLFVAVDENCPKTARVLLNHGSDPSFIFDVEISGHSYSNLTCFHIAAALDRDEIVKTMLESRPELVNVKDGNNNTALRMAREHHCSKVIAILESLMETPQQ